MRLVVARCEVTYTGRLTAHLPEATRLLVFKADGSVLVHADSGGFKPLNWMTPPTVIEDGEDVIVVRKRAGRTEDRLEIKILELIAEVSHELGEDAGLEKDGVERHLQEELAAQPHVLEEGLRLVRREWATDVGPVDLMCRDADDGWVAVEIKRIGTIEAVEQLSRYLEVLRPDPALSECTRNPRRPEREAAGAHALRGARSRLRRGRSRGAARRARAGSDAVQRLTPADCRSHRVARPFAQPGSNGCVEGCGETGTQLEQRWNRHVTRNRSFFPFPWAGGG